MAWIEWKEIRLLNNSSRRDYATQNEEKAKWGRTAES